MRLDAAAFARSTCSVVFERGSQPMGGAAEVNYHLDKDSTDNRFEIASANGKVYAGTFSFVLVDDAGTSMRIANGRFEAEDRQL